MAKVKGQVDWDKWKNGEVLTRNEAIKAMCYECNGFEEGGVDCDAGNGYDNCPLYEFMPYRKRINNKNNIVKVKKERTEKQLANDKKLGKRMKEKKNGV